jgi:hypothetical protein
MPRPTFAALACALVALAVAVVLLGQQRSLDRCQYASARVYTHSREHLGGVPKAVRELMSRCPGSDTLVRAAGGLLKPGPRSAVITLAQEAVRREPDNASAWATLAVATDGVRPRQAAAARRRALTLNPLLGRAARP